MPALAEMGVTSLWIPPACKAYWGGSTGYDTYDLYDLGEFDQKGGAGTKYGTRAELERLVAAAGRCGVDVLFDIVVNHKAGADYAEPARGVRVEQYGTYSCLLLCCVTSVPPALPIPPLYGCGADKSNPFSQTASGR